MAQVIQRRFPRPTFHAAPVQHGEPPLSPADGGPPFHYRRHSDHRSISAGDETGARKILMPGFPPRRIHGSAEELPTSLKEPNDVSGG